MLACYHKEINSDLLSSSFRLRPKATGSGIKSSDIICSELNIVHKQNSS